MKFNSDNNDSSKKKTQKNFIIDDEDIIDEVPEILDSIDSRKINNQLEASTTNNKDIQSMHKFE